MGAQIVGVRSPPVGVKQKLMSGISEIAEQAMKESSTRTILLQMADIEIIKWPENWFVKRIGCTIRDDLL